MTATEEQLERIVRQVLEQLRRETGATNRPTANAASQAKTVTAATLRKKEETSSKRLQLDVAVVTTTQLEGRLGGVEQVIVRRGAVITPAVRDLLKEKSVTLSWSTDGAAENKSTAATNITLAVGLAEATYSPAELLRKLTSQSIAIQRIAQTGLTTSVDEIAVGVARSGQLGLLLTDNTAAALCLANRHRGVRAVAPANRGDAAAAVKSLGANMLIISPRGRSLSELEQITLVLVRGSSHGCPEAYRGRLD